MKKMFLALFAVALFVGASLAATPIKLSLWDKVATPQDDSVEMLEIGIGTYTPELIGVCWNLIYSRTDNATAWQTGLVTRSKQFVGYQTGFIVFSENFKGLSSGFINLNKGEAVGVQYGFFNKAKSVRGWQIGIINITENMYGVQIGLANFIKTGKLPVMIIVNAKFKM